MIGKKELALVGMGQKLVKKLKKNFQNFTEHDFYVRVILVDKNTGLFVKAVEVIANSENWMEYLTSMDFGDYLVDKIELSASGR